MKKILYIIPLIAFVILGGCNKNIKTKGLQGKLIIFHAGSLSIPIKALADTFNLEHPDLEIQTESAGSLTSIRKITDLNRSCDILASADYLLIDKMMIPEHTSWNMKFAVNEMSLVFTEKSREAENIDKDNWYGILMKDNIRYGRADPSSDPCGYRTILTLKLAEKLMNKKGLASNLIGKDNKYIRPKEVDLLALLESQSIDYIFIYKSIAMQHGLNYIDLPDSINLSKPSLASWYSGVSVNISGNNPKESIIQNGEPMVYGITIPDKAKNIEAAKAFTRFVLSKRGSNIIRTNYQAPLYPAELSEKSKLPDWL